MSTEQVYHYVYRITNMIENKHYYGKRSSKIEPKLDLGVRYFSSSSDKDFIKDQKANPQNYRYKIIIITCNSTKALSYENRLHIKFNVSTNPFFYNKAIQPSPMFNCEGRKAYHLLGKPLSLEHRAKLSAAGKGKRKSEDHKKKIGEAQKGKVIPQKVIDNMSGVHNYNHKIANIYEYSTNKLLAENVVIREWCKLNLEYNQSHLSKTANADRELPSNGKNPHQHKGIFARYIKTS